MTEPSFDKLRFDKLRIEEIVARCEVYQYSLPRDEQRALIASWRARGEALAEARDMIKGFSFGKRLAAKIDAALAAEPIASMDETERALEDAVAAGKLAKAVNTKGEVVYVSPQRGGAALNPEPLSKDKP
jgi:hypothetical protein